jgi:hypothetical protein
LHRVSFSLTRDWLDVGRGLDLPAIADSIGFSGVFPYMGFATHPHARMTGARKFTPNVTCS